MYHCIVLEDYLDVIDLLARNPGLASAADTACLRAAAERGLRFLAGIPGGDGELPLFNDSAFGIAPAPQRLRAYGDRVPGIAARPELNAPLRVSFPDSGYFGYRHGGDSLLIDCGVVGPDYQPGHAHCDTLSYELCVGGRRMIVDSGVYNYDAGEMRRYVRSTAAHNTVRIDGAEQSEVWGAFRVARRARPREVDIGDWESGVLRFAGGHDGYCRLPGAPLHRRTVTMATAGRWEVTDQVTGGGTHTVESFIHLHPGLTLTRSGEREFTARHPAGIAVRIRMGGTGRIREETGYYCPEFGIRQENRVLVMEEHAALPIALSYVIERI
jgi:uncharacterized heparinase superfamily protein